MTCHCPFITASSFNPSILECKFNCVDWICHSVPRFNLTILECKFHYFAWLLVSLVVLICLYWNINLYSSPVFAKYSVGLNPSILECKDGQSYDYDNHHLVLIRSYWNVNKSPLLPVKRPALCFNLSTLECKYIWNTFNNILRGVNLSILECK